VIPNPNRGCSRCPVTIRRAKRRHDRFDVAKDNGRTYAVVGVFLLLSSSSSLRACRGLERGCLHELRPCSAVLSSSPARKRTDIHCREVRFACPQPFLSLVGGRLSIATIRHEMLFYVNMRSKADKSRNQKLKSGRKEELKSRNG